MKTSMKIKRLRSDDERTLMRSLGTQLNNLSISDITTLFKEVTLHKVNIVVTSCL